MCSAGCAAAPLAQTTSAEHWQTETARIMPRAARLEASGANVCTVKDASGATLGRLLLERGNAGGRKFGYAGFIEVALLLDAQDRVAGVLLGENLETPRFLARVRDAGFLTRWNRLELAAVPGHEVDAVSSATYSSEAIRYGVRRLAAQAQGGDYRENPTAVREEIAWLERRIERLRRMTRQCESELAELRRNTSSAKPAAGSDEALRLAEAESELEHCRITVREAEARLAYLKAR